MTRSGRALERVPGAREVRLVAAPGGGVEEIVTDTAAAAALSLGDDAPLAVIELALACE